MQVLQTAESALQPYGNYLEMNLEVMCPCTAAGCAKLPHPLTPNSFLSS